MPDRLNFFEPWTRPANHEDQLTRALLVILRYCPIIQQAWLSLVDAAAPSSLAPKVPTLTLHSLPRATFDTQRAQILRDEHQPKMNEPIIGISVLCSADKSNEVQSAVMESDRGQVLDGIVRYGDDLVVVLESKLHDSADDLQARNINLYGQPVHFDGPVRKISWRDVLASFSDLADEKRGLISGAEREILNDFLIFVDTNFPQLGPFNTLGRCAAEPSRVWRRLHAILSEVLGTDGTTLPGTPDSVSLARLEYDEGDGRHVTLRMWPADTLQQARVFYGRPNAIQDILALEHKGWTISPNFHFGFMAKGFCWTTTAMTVAEYLRYWQKNIEDARQIDREDWNQYWSTLLNAKVATLADREQFDRDFTNTGRSSASPRPGMQCEFDWSLEHGERLDARGQFTKDVKDRMNQLLHTLGENEIGSE